MLFCSFAKLYFQTILLCLLRLNQLPFRDFIIADHSLPAAFKAVDFFASLFQMFLAHSGIHFFRQSLKLDSFNSKRISSMTSASLILN